MFDPTEEFRKFATKDRGISSTTLDRFQSAYANYISPTIIEERSMNVASMDVFSRLMMDRIIFWCLLTIMWLISYKHNYCS